MDRYGALILILLISVSQLVSFSTARNIPGEEFLPVTDGVIISGEVSALSKTVKGKLATVVGCESEDDHFMAGYSSSPGVYVAGIYGSLVLNVLPKGSVPASGPSKRINDVKT
ncbi:hypothetical protein F2Q69_00045536 [Brassica cretica]|uniref:AT-hook motif nuclear-localized protein n=3 Tax=Brassica TaxID=3705 RepID=A0A0D3EHM7_BRAOL|nr:PREDICTED: uncharacterized protein LOC106315988 [Brassica oleracea var. oleracea]KAF3500084.1 hypothetical protein F2Q69_00045536 [Brassica cretica]VDD34580.1 unnamed protein product [Brassica oleracea]